MAIIVPPNSEENGRTVLEKEKIEVDGIIAESSLFGKAGKIRKAMKEAGAGISGTMCVGDEERDILAARKAGVKIISAEWGYSCKELLKGADYFAKKPADILKILSKQNHFKRK